MSSDIPSGVAELHRWAKPMKTLSCGILAIVALAGGFATGFWFHAQREREHRDEVIRAIGASESRLALLDDMVRFTATWEEEHKADFYKMLRDQFIVGWEPNAQDFLREGVTAQRCLWLVQRDGEAGVREFVVDRANRIRENLEMGRYLNESEKKLAVAFLGALEREGIIQKNQTAQPGATDNPDDAQRLREDH